MTSPRWSQSLRTWTRPCNDQYVVSAFRRTVCHGPAKAGHYVLSRRRRGVRLEADRGRYVRDQHYVLSRRRRSVCLEADRGRYVRDQYYVLSRRRRSVRLEADRDRYVRDQYVVSAFRRTVCHGPAKAGHYVPFCTSLRNHRANLDKDKNMSIAWALLVLVGPDVEVRCYGWRDLSYWSYCL